MKKKICIILIACTLFFNLIPKNIFADSTGETAVKVNFIRKITPEELPGITNKKNVDDKYVAMAENNEKKYIKFKNNSVLPKTNSTINNALIIVGIICIFSSFILILLYRKDEQFYGNKN